MLRLLYTLGISSYYLAARIYALFNRKAAAFVRGRSQVWNDIGGIEDGASVFWFHCASVGEFEQVRPVMEGLHERHPGRFFLLPFGLTDFGCRVRPLNLVANWIVRRYFHVLLLCA